MKKVLILGIKEYPIGSSNGEDKRSLGGIEYGLSRIIDGIKKDFYITIITRKFSKTPVIECDKNIKIIRLRWIKGFLRGVSYNFNTFLYLLFKKLDYDVVITSGVFSTFFVGILKIIRFKKFKILCRWDTPLYLLNSKVYFPLEYITYNYLIDYFILKDSFEAKRVKKLYFTKKKILIAGFGIPGSNISMSINKNIIKKSNYITGIFIGRLISQKNIFLTIEIFKELNKHVKINLKIFGEGPLKEDLLKYISKEDYNFVNYMGYTNNSLKEIKNSSFLILLSKTEGLPNVVLEAFSCKTPVIISNIGLFNKNIVYIADISKSPKEIAMAILSFITNKKKIMNCSDLAFKYYKKNYDYENMINNYRDIINLM